MFALMSKNNLPAFRAANPAVVDGKVIVGSEDGSVYCFGGKK
jgi:outer membrane protein assembly factor BamB